jgi:hypothetical protein
MTTQSSDTSTDALSSKHGHIAKLTATNYHVWKSALQYNLHAIRAWNIVMSEEQPPDAPANIAHANVALRKYYRDEQKDYETRYHLAAAMIYQSCLAAIQPIVQGMTDLRTMWQSLKEHLDRTAKEGSSLFIRQQLLKERYDSKSSITEFVSRLYEFRD